MNHLITMPMFRVVAGAEGMYFAGRDALATAGGHDLLLHLMHPGFLLLCAYVIIESMQFAQAWMRSRKAGSTAVTDPTAAPAKLPEADTARAIAATPADGRRGKRAAKRGTRARARR